MKIIDKIVDSLDGLFSRLEARTQARREKGPSKEDRLVIYRAAALRSLITRLPFNFPPQGEGEPLRCPDPPTVEDVGITIAAADRIARQMVALEGAST